MKLLPSHIEDLKRVIAKKQMRQSDFTIDVERASVTFHSRRGHQYTFRIAEVTTPQSIGQGFYVFLNPGVQHTDEREFTKGWREAHGVDGHRMASIIDLFHTWVDSVRREIAADVGSGDADPTPVWATSPELTRIKAQIAELNSRAAALEERLAVLWQTGDTLNEAVRAMFEDIGFGAQHTAIGATYDLLISLSNGRRLLVEITGIEGNLTKGKGGKIAQIVDAYNNAEKGDRVIVIVNAYRKLPLETRIGPLASDDALRLVKALDAVVCSTKTLYGIWEQSLTDATAARSRIEELATWEAGVFT